MYNFSMSFQLTPRAKGLAAYIAGIGCMIEMLMLIELFLAAI
jgi:hypothetical protein